MIKRLIACIAVVSVSFCLSNNIGAADVVQEQQQVQQLLDKYLESVKTADLALATQIWWQSPDVSMVVPFGRLSGWESVRDGLYVNFLQQAFSERRLQADKVAIIVSDNTAWAVFDWTFTAKLQDGQPYSSKGWESHIYRKINGRWVIAHLHYSAPLPTPPN